MGVYEIHLEKYNSIQTYKLYRILFRLLRMHAFVTHVTLIPSIITVKLNYHSVLFILLFTLGNWFSTLSKISILLYKYALSRLHLRNRWSFVYFSLHVRLHLFNENVLYLLSQPTRKNLSMAPIIRRPLFLLLDWPFIDLRRTSCKFHFPLTRYTCWIIRNINESKKRINRRIVPIDYVQNDAIRYTVGTPSMLL